MRGVLLCAATRCVDAIRAWSLDANECVAALRGRADYVSRLIARNNTLYSGSGDETIRAWSLDANECVATSQGHASYAQRLIARNKRVVFRKLGQDHPRLETLVVLAKYNPSSVRN